jgi:ankyrin repeat protein
MTMPLADVTNVHGTHHSTVTVAPPQLQKPEDAVVQHPNSPHSSGDTFPSPTEHVDDAELDSEFVDLDHRDDKGYTPLHWAAQAGSVVECLELLHAFGDRVARRKICDSANVFGQTCAHLAASCGSLELLREFIRRAPELLIARDHDDCTVLNLAAAKNHESCVRFLLNFVIAHPELQVILNNADVHGRTPLMFATFFGHRNIVRAFLENADIRSMLDVNYCDDEGYSALMWAADNSFPEIFDLLLRHGACPRVINAKGRCLLHFAARSQPLTTLAAALSVVPDLIDHLDCEQETPLHFAANVGNIDACRMLIEHGASVSLLDIRGSSALHYACFAGYFTIVEMLIEAGADVLLPCDLGSQPLHYASRSGNIQVCERLISRGADVHARGYLGRTPLIEAARKGHPDLVGFYLAKFINIDIDARDDLGRTALHEAAAKGYTGVVALLLSHHTTVDCADQEGNTALSKACQGGHFACMKLLMDAGAVRDGMVEHIHTLSQAMMNQRDNGRKMATLSPMFEATAPVPMQTVAKRAVLNRVIQQQRLQEKEHVLEQSPLQDASWSSIERQLFDNGASNDTSAIQQQLLEEPSQLQNDNEQVPDALAMDDLDGPSEKSASQVRADVQKVVEEASNFRIHSEPKEQVLPMTVVRAMMCDVVSGVSSLTHSMEESLESAAHAMSEMRNQIDAQQEGIASLVTALERASVQQTKATAHISQLLLERRSRPVRNESGWSLFEAFFLSIILIAMVLFLFYSVSTALTPY